MRRCFSLLLLTSIVTACSCGGASSDPNTAEPHVLKGTVKNAAGEPIPGVKVLADDLNAYNAHTIGYTGEDGSFRVVLSPTTVTSYRALAIHELTWDGQRWVLRMASDTNQAFAGADGAIRHFTWTLEGNDGLLSYGGEVYVYTDLDDDTPVEVDLVPVGPRIDGSEGSPITLRLSEGYRHADIPLSRYTVTARDTGNDAVPLKVRVRNAGSFVESVDAGFRSVSSATRMMEIEVSSL